MMAVLGRQILLLIAISSVLGFSRRCHSKKYEIEQEKKNPPVSLIRLSYSTFDLDESNEISFTPVIIWHGSGDTASDQKSVTSLIMKLYKETPVFAIRVGDNDIQDIDASIWGDADSQIEEVCRAIIENVSIQRSKKINFIGFSQGALLIRGLIERCPLEEHSIEVNNFISIGGPQQGVYGIPKDMIKNKFSSKMMTKGASLLAYMNHFQKNCMAAGYWHDPKNKATYRKKTFLADINNEGSTYHEEYKTRFSSINKLVLVKFNYDDMITPPESSHFGFFTEGSTRRIDSMTETDLYKLDLIGLRYLNENERIDFIELETNHLNFTQKWFRQTIVKLYLNPVNLDE